MLNTSIYGACIYIFCNPLLHNIIQVKGLTLYEYASVKVIKKKKSDPHLTSYAELGRHRVFQPYLDKFVVIFVDEI